MGNPVPVVDVAKNELLLVATHNNTFPMVLSAPLGSNGCEVSVHQNQKSDYTCSFTRRTTRVCA